MLKLMKPSEGNTMEEFSHSRGPGEYIINTCAWGPSEFAQNRVSGWGKSGWKKRKWLRHWWEDRQRTNTNVGAERRF